VYLGYYGRLLSDGNRRRKRYAEKDVNGRRQRDAADPRRADERSDQERQRI
jgi:hypothetical protein